MAESDSKVVIFGAAGRVGQQISSELLRQGLHVVMVDIVPQMLMDQLAGRLLNDSRLALGRPSGSVSTYGDVNALDLQRVTDLLATERPQLVINYAIPITWDATKRLPNYASVSAAGLGAFTPIQVVAPLTVGRAISEAGLDAKFMVGNLPDITVPTITGIARGGGVCAPACGAGNVGLNQVAFRRQLAIDLAADFEDIELFLASHHVHWVAPREPGYSNAAPFMAKVMVKGVNRTEELGDLREIMNRGVVNFYESGAAFSSTTGILASRIALALMDTGPDQHFLHTPAPNGLPGGYPVRIQSGEIGLNLPQDWVVDDAISAMNKCHTLDGVEKIEVDGAVQFSEQARTILYEEIGFELPISMSPSDITQVAQAQISLLENLFASS